MILYCVSKDSPQLTEGKKYFCITIELNFKSQEIHYRLVNDDNEIVLYNANLFSLYDGTLNDMILKIISNYHSRIELREIDVLNKHAWEDYYVEDDKIFQEKLHNIVIQRARDVGIIIDNIISY